MYKLYSLLNVAPDDERLDLLEKCRADEKLWNKIGYKNCASRWSFTQSYSTLKKVTQENNELVEQ